MELAQAHPASVALVDRAPAAKEAYRLFICRRVALSALVILLELFDRVTDLLFFVYVIGKPLRHDPRSQQEQFAIFVIGNLSLYLFVVSIWLAGKVIQTLPFYDDMSEKPCALFLILLLVTPFATGELKILANLPSREAYEAEADTDAAAAASNPLGDVSDFHDILSLRLLNFGMEDCLHVLLCVIYLSLGFTPHFYGTNPSNPPPLSLSLLLSHSRRIYFCGSVLETGHSHHRAFDCLWEICILRLPLRGGGQDENHRVARRAALCHHRHHLRNCHWYTLG